MKKLQQLLLVFLISGMPFFGFGQRFNYQYHVKFVCGKFDGKILSPGIYHSAINILNPNKDTIRFNYRLSFANVGNPEFVSSPSNQDIGPFITKEIDCPVILKYSRSSRAKGFAIISSPLPLDIVTVYTVADAKMGVKSIDVEKYYPFKSPSADCPDLIIREVRLGNGDNEILPAKIVVTNIGSMAAPAGYKICLKIQKGSTMVDIGGIAAVEVVLDPGQSTIVDVSINRSDLGSDATALIFEVDCGNAVPECNEGNNTKLVPLR